MAAIVTVLGIGIVPVTTAAAAPLPLTMSVSTYATFGSSFGVSLSGVPGRTVVLRYAGRSASVPLGSSGKASATFPVNGSMRAGSYSVQGTYYGQTHAAAAKELRVRAATSVLVQFYPLSQKYLGTPSRTYITVRGTDGQAALGSVNIYRNGKLFARKGLSSGKASLLLPFAWGVGNNDIGVRFVPGDYRYLTSTGHGYIAVTKGATTTTMKLASRVVVGQPTRMTLAVTAPHGPATGSVTIKSGYTTLATRPLDSRGYSYYDLPRYASGTHTISVIYNGNAAFLGSSATAKSTVVRARPVVHVSVPSVSSVGARPTVTASVSGGYGTPPGSATVRLDGRAVGTVAARGGSLQLPALGGGNHTVTVSYGGSKVYAPASGSAAVRTNPCSPSARACVDLTHNLAWIQQSGKIIYGPVPMLSGRPGYRTPSGMFSVYWKDIDHKSSIFDDAPMPYSIFFNGGVAFHEGSLYVLSHGCIHLSHSAATYYWNALDYGDTVHVFGYGPY
jgi:hypothetical protein